jgi:ribosomal protein S12 methylthiotransferase
MVDGPSAQSDLVLEGRLRSQAPGIDPVVYLTDCDPARFEPGRVIRARVADARGYDLVARPEA